MTLSVPGTVVNSIAQVDVFPGASFACYAVGSAQALYGSYVQIVPYVSDLAKWARNIVSILDKHDRFLGLMVRRYRRRRTTAGALAVRSVSGPTISQRWLWRIGASVSTERKYSRSRTLPISRDQSALLELRLKPVKEVNDVGAQVRRMNVLATNLDNAWTSCVRRGEDTPEVQVMGKDNIAAISRPAKDFRI